MAWIQPKTDWHCEIIDGVYSGDRFNASDYNRIKNNLSHLHTLALSLYKSFTVQSVGNDKQIGEFFYADEINKLESNLDTINSHTINRQYGDTPTYVDNGRTFDFNELNRLESAILDLYERMNNQKIGRRQFKWNFGMLGGGL
jgi:hypothetical protein